jgi:molecular chaperone IbpA
MTRVTSIDLTPFYRNSIGVDRLFDRIMNQIDTSAHVGNYPPYDIVKTGGADSETYEIRLAVAGFTQGEIDVTFHDGTLTVTGEKKREDQDDTMFLHRGISARKFTRTFPLADYIEVKSATCQDGILTVSLERIVPESARPKSIAITYVS